MTNGKNRGDNMVIKKHAVYGDVNLNFNVIKEDDCDNCAHVKACQKDWPNHCMNYIGTGDQRERCNGCLLRYTRPMWCEKGIPCFKCTDMVPIGSTIWTCGECSNGKEICRVIINVVIDNMTPECPFPKGACKPLWKKEKIVKVEDS